MKRILLPAFLLILTTSFTANSQTQTPTDAPALEQGKVVTRDISGGDMHQYSVKVPTGGFVHVDVDQIGINIMVLVFVDKQQVRRVNNTGGGDSESFSLIAENATTFRLEVQAPDKFATAAKYTIEL